MTPSCRQCGRANPPDAIYCYYDGISLAGLAQLGPQDLALTPFPSPFHFPSGEKCVNFDQMALSCQRLVDDTWKLLCDGTMSRFLAGMGRADLPSVVQEAVDMGDGDRGVDHFLSRLPCKNLAPAALQTDSPRIHCGTLVHGQQVAFSLTLRNAGHRLVHGVAAPDCDWLQIDGAAAGQSRLVQFWHDQTLKVRLDGDKIPASIKPREGNIRIDTNAGSLVIPVACSMPIVPFPSGPLVGSMTPRDVALKAKQFPKESADLFASGAVHAWYRSNGWIYPVEGEAASGMAAIQQFFEALGLVKPPRVAIDTQSLDFEGKQGKRFRRTIQLRTEDKRPVFASAQSNSPWVTVVGSVSRGNVATVEIEVVVPSADESLIETHLDVRANGAQRFRVPISIRIEAELLEIDEVDEGEPFHISTQRRAKRSPRRMLAATLFFGTLAILIPAGMFLLWHFSPVLFRQWSTSPLEAHKAAVSAGTYLLVHVDFDALEKSPDTGEQTRQWTQALADSVRDLDLQPAGPPRSALIALAKGEPPLTVLTFAAPVRAGKVLAGRFESRTLGSHDVFVDRLDPTHVWAIDDKGRLAGGSKSEVEAFLKRARSRRTELAYKDFARLSDGLSGDAPVWLVGNFQTVNVSEAWPALVDPQRCKGIHLSIGNESGRGIVLHAQADFATESDAVACRQRLFALPDEAFALQGQAIPGSALMKRGDWKLHDSKLKVDSVVELATGRALVQTLAQQRAMANQLEAASLDKLCTDQMQPALNLLKQGDYARAIESLENCLSLFPNRAEAKQHLQEAKKGLAEKQEYDAGVEKARRSLTSGDLTGAQVAIQQLKKSPHAEAKLAALERDWMVQEQQIRFQNTMKEGTAALANGSLDVASKKFEAAQKIRAADPESKRASEAVAWIRKARELLEQAEIQRKAANMTEARGAYSRVAQMLSQGKMDRPWTDAPFRALRDELHEKCVQTGRGIVNDLWNLAQQAGSTGSIAAIKEEFPKSLQAYQSADQSLQQAEGVLDELHRSAGTSNDGQAPDQKRVANQRAEIRKAISGIEGQALLFTGSQELKQAKNGIADARAQPRRVPELQAMLASALKSLQQADRLKQPNAAALVEEAEALQLRLQRLLKPLSIDFQNEPIPTDWKNEKDHWSLVADARMRRWLVAEKGNSALLRTSISEWPTDFEMDMEFCLLNEKIDNSHWPFYADPLVVTLVARDPRAPSLVIGLGNDSSLTMLKRSRLRVGKTNSSLETLIAPSAPIRLRLVAEQGTLKVFFNGRLLSTSDVASDFHQLTVAASNPFHTGLNRVVARVALSSIEVRALGVVPNKTPRPK